MHIITHHTPALLLGLLGSSAAVHAAFTGSYDLAGEETPPGFYENLGAVQLGAWTALIPQSTTFVSSWVDTSSLSGPPIEQVTLRAEATASTSAVIEVGTILFIVVPETGLLTFNLAVGTFGSDSATVAGGYALDENSVIYTGRNDGAQNFNEVVNLPVTAGQQLSFFALASTDLAPDEETLNYGTATVSVFGFGFTPIPEPSSFAVFAGLAALACGGLRRRPRA